MSQFSVTESKPRVLIVDDEKLNINILNELLRDDYQIMVATSGEQALKAVAKMPPDLILLDVMLPDMNGYAVCKSLKNHEETHNTF